MDKGLRTGEMIDQLKVGEVAEAIKGTYEGCKVTRTNSDEIVLVKKNGLENFLTLNTFAMKTEWIIIPKFVSFNEAMTAYQDGKTINSYIDDSGLRCADYSILNKNGSDQEISIMEILEGKWTITD